jgi:hypothetical protein
MADDFLIPIPRATLLEFLRDEEADAGVITLIVDAKNDAGEIGNFLQLRAQEPDEQPGTLEMLELKGETEQAQRQEIAKVLKAGNAPVDYTMVLFQEEGKEVEKKPVLFFRPDNGAWAKSLVQATAGLRDDIVKVAGEEWKFFGEQEINAAGVKTKTGIEEHSDKGSDQVALYWREGVNEPGITGKDRNQYWSAAFISYVMHKAGAGALFKRSDHHQEYIYAAMMAAKEKREDYGYWGAKLGDAAPEKGDLICAWREGQITFERAQKPGSYASHCDLVVDTTADTVTVIGGNVSQSVTKRTFKLVNGKVHPDEFPQTFAILKNRMPAAAETAVSATALAQAAAALPAGALPQVKFEPLGENTPIRGIFSITAQQIASLCTGAKARYAFYAAAIADNSPKYGLNPLFVLANFINQGVREEYRNPWGISVDHYPVGPNKTQLGKPNGKVKNGPRRFDENEWRTAFDRQYSVVAGERYKKAMTIAQWALIDAPPGAANDVHGTNAGEGRHVGTIYNKLVSVLKASA